MPLVDPQIGPFLFSSANIVCEDWTISSPRDVEIMSAAIEEQGASSQGKLAGRSVRMQLYIRGTTPSELQDNISALQAATSSDLPQDLHLEPQFPGRYLLVKRNGDLSVQPVISSPGTIARATVEFFADDPYWISATTVTQRATLSSASVQITIDLSGVGASNARWIPIIGVFQIGTVTLASGKSIKITNTTTQPNEIMRYKASTDLTGGSGKTALFDGESKEIVWDGTLENKNFAGTFPRVRGGIANVMQIDLDPTGSNGVSATTTLDFVYAPRWS